MSQSRIGNSELISSVNNRLVLQAIRVMQPTYRAEVARRTGLKPATVTGIVNNLISEGTLREIPATIDPGTRWGRPPLLLQVNRDAKRILAIDLEPDRIRVALTDLLVNVLSYHEQALDRFSEPKDICQLMVKLAESALEGVDRRQILGAGVSLAGLIDQAAGVGLSSTNMPKWHNVRVRDILEKKLHIPVQIERSIHLAAMYEKWSDPNHAHRTVVIVSLRTGVGVSIMHHGRLFTGRGGFEGEIGHTVVDLNGRECECGGRGCLETFVSASAICRRASEMMAQGRCAALQRLTQAGTPLRPELIYQLAKDGYEDCATIVREVGRYIGIAVSNLINLLAPDEVVICGAIDVVDKLILQAVREQIDKIALPRSRENLTVRLAREKDRLPLLGAAVLVAEEMFELPSLRHMGVAEADDEETEEESGGSRKATMQAVAK